jgi:hypothetical protein
VALGVAASVVLTARTANDLTVTRWWPGGETRQLRRLVAQIAPGVPVSVNERMVPHLAARSDAYIFPAHGVAMPAYVLDLDTALDAAARAGDFPREHYDEVGRAGRWVLLALRP